MSNLLDVQNLNVSIKHNETKYLVVKDISFHIQKGECLGIVGESGCGKSLTAATIACLKNDLVEGKVLLGGVDILSLLPADKRRIRASEIAIIFQNPQSSLNPTLRVGKQVQEVNRKLTKQNIIDLFLETGLKDPERCYYAYPHELSGGMCQRVMIAMALAKKPKLLIADEPTTSLDKTTENQILDLIKSIIEKTQMAVLLITHDFRVLEKLADRVAIMYAGEIVESGLLSSILKDAKHPFTQGLLAARPKSGEGKTYQLETIPGIHPPLNEQIEGCNFSSRCKFAKAICNTKKPPQITEESQFVKCWKNQGAFDVST